MGWIVELRGFLALYVLLHHAINNIDGSGTPGALRDWTLVLFGPGHFRVDIFFVLSGFCLTLAMKGQSRLESIGQFLMQRSARLLPPYFAAVILSWMLARYALNRVTGTHWDVSIPLHTGTLLTHLLLIHNWWPSFAVNLNHPLWSIAVEFQLYFVFPALLWLHRSVSPWKAWAVTTLLSYAAWRIQSDVGFGDPSPYGTSFYYAALFSMGVTAGQLHQVLRLSDTLRTSDFLVMSVVFALMLGWTGLNLHHYGYVALQLQSFYVGFATMLAFILQQRWTLWHGRFWAPVQSTLRYAGERSYSLYLLHAPILQIVWLTMVKRLHLHAAGWMGVAEMTLGTLTSFAAAEVFFRHIEQPTHAWSRRLGGLWRAPATARA